MTLNLVMLTLGFLLIYVSLNAIDHDFGLDTLNDDHSRAVHIYIATTTACNGVIISVLATIGYIGAYRKSKVALGMYAGIIFFLMAILAVINLVMLTLGSADNSYQRDVDKSLVNTTLSSYNHTDTAGIGTIVVDYVQKRLSCCGINSPDDWKEYGSYKKIAKSCCFNNTKVNQKPFFKYCEQSTFEIGCWKAMTDQFGSNISRAKTILQSTMIFGLVCSSATLLMIRNIK